MRHVLFLALAALASGCVAEPESLTETLASVGIVEYGEQEGDDFTFGLVSIDQRFRVDPDAVPEFDALFEAFQSSSDTGRSMRVVFDVDSGRFDPDGTLPSYRVHRIEYDDTAFDVWRGRRKRVDEPPAAESSLARGVAYYSSGTPDRAVPAIDVALAGSLRPKLRALALNLHGNALSEAVSVAREVPNESDDRQLLRALDDFRQWSALEPENPEVQLAIGLALRRLGAYDEAIEILGKLIAAWPEERVRVITRIGSTYRIMGDYPRALATLDQFAAGEDPPFGMMFNYHRGWILNLMGRHEEALLEFSEGLKTQPDYGGAFEQRACAYARLGRLEEALQDHRRADKLNTAYFADIPPNPAIEHDRAWALSVGAALKAAIASGSNAPNSAPCEGYWSYGEKRRERSRFLPAYKAGDAPAVNAI